MFEVGREKYQLPRSDVYKVLRFWENGRDGAAVGGGADGRIIYRGRPVKVVDVRRHAGVEQTARGPDTRIILLQRKTGLIGLLVDRVIAGEPPKAARSRWDVG